MRPLISVARRPTPDSRLVAAAEIVRGHLGPRLLSISYQAGDILCLEVDRSDLLATATFLRDAPELRFDFLSCVSGVDMVSHMLVVYHLHSLSNRLTAQLKVKADAREPVVDSVSAIWPTANWHEREAFDMLGIQFNGHPNLERLLLVEGFVGYPLRRNYQLPRRRWPHGRMVEEGGPVDERS